jgi:hypothetical protein
VRLISGIGCSGTLIAFVLLTLVSTASATRKASATEHAALTQAVFDVLPRVAAKDAIAGTRIAGIRVTTKAPHFSPAAKFYYRTFAAVEIVNPNVGGAVMFFGYYVSGVPGWRLLSGPGSLDVGCDVPETVFHGFKRAVLQDLQLTCTQ